MIALCGSYEDGLGAHIDTLLPGRRAYRDTCVNTNSNILQKYKLIISGNIEKLSFYILELGGFFLSPIWKTRLDPSTCPTQTSPLGIQGGLAPRQELIFMISELSKSVPGSTSRLWQSWLVSAS